MSFPLSMPIAGPLSYPITQYEGVGWDPAALGANLLGDWDVDRTSSLTLSSGAIVTWADAVTGIAPTQGTAANRPAYDDDGWIDGTPVAVFDGVNDELSIDSQPFPSGAGAVEIWGIVRQDKANTGGGATSRWFGYGGTTNQTSRQGRLVDAAGGNIAQGSAGNGGADVVASGPSVAIAGPFDGVNVERIVVTATQLRVDRNGVAGTAAACVPNTGTTRVKIGAAMTSAGFWTGGVKRILLTNLLSGSDETNMWRYALRKCFGTSGVRALLWLDGDSYSTETGAQGLLKRLIAAGRRGSTSGVGGGTLSEALARVQARPWMNEGVQIIWDGSPNSYGTLEEDMAKYAAMVAVCPRTIVIPPVRRRVNSAGELTAASALQTAIATTYAGRTIDAHGLLMAAATSPGDDADVTDNVVPRSLLIDHVSDAHLNSAGWDVIYPAVASLLTSLGW